MKRRMMMMAMMMAIAVSAAAMSYSKARVEALFLSDKMAYELRLSNAQYDAVYEINLDYLMSVNSRYDILGSNWARRNSDMFYVLNSYQYSRYMTIDYFYRPIDYVGSSWRFSVYNHYADRSLFYYAHPTVYVSYRGGHNAGHNSYYAGRSFSGGAMSSHHASTNHGDYKSLSNGNTQNWHSSGNSGHTGKSGNSGYSVSTGKSGNSGNSGNTRSFGNARNAGNAGNAKSSGNFGGSNVQRFGARK